MPAEPPRPCAGPATPELAAALAAFNHGDYLACHEHLEALWLAEKRSDRDVYRGFLQLAAALLQEEQGNRAGALRLLSSGLTLLAPLAPACLGLDVAGLLADGRSLLATLEGLPAGHSLPLSARPTARLAAD